MTLPIPTALIIGAGLAGLTAARVLADTPYAALVLDKARAVGGRMATRRIGQGQADHGAQFFSVRSPKFQAVVDEWLAEDLVFEWARGWSDGSASGERDGHPRYAARGGMNTLMRHFAQGLNARIGVEISSIAREGNGWEITDKHGVIYETRALILTPPVPQSLQLLDAGGVNLDTDQRATLEAIQYDPCIAGLFAVNGSINLPEPGALQRPNAPLSWIADNKAKGLSSQTVVTAHLNPDTSRALFDQPDAVVLDTFKTELAPFMDVSHIAETQIKRWRYSQPQTVFEDRCLIARALPPLIFAGDAFGGPRVEGAYLSGLNAGEAMRAMLA